MLPNGPNMEFVVPNFDSPPTPPRDRPPNPDSVSDAMESSVAEVISTDMVGAERGGAWGGKGSSGSCTCDCWLKPKGVLPKADGVPENALNPNAPVLEATVAFRGETEPKALVPFAGGVENVL